MTGPDASVLDHKSKAGILIFPFFSCTPLFSCWGIRSALADCSSTQPQFGQRQSQLFPSVSEDGVKCQLHPTAGRLRAPEDNLGKARVALGAGMSLTPSLCSKLKYTQSSFLPSELGPKPSPASSPWCLPTNAFRVNSFSCSFVKNMIYLSKNKVPLP